MSNRNDLTTLCLYDILILRHLDFTLTPAVPPVGLIQMMPKHLVTCIMPNLNMMLAPAPSPMPITHLIWSTSRMLTKSSPISCRPNEKENVKKVLNKFFKCHSPNLFMVKQFKITNFYNFAPKFWNLSFWTLFQSRNKFKVFLILNLLSNYSYYI